MALTGHSVVAQISPALVWVTNSSIKLEQVIGDVDWALRSNTASQTISRTIGTNVYYNAADPID
jgi:hypothetical protein